jgi:membrane protein YdbS with pleckstrin-like domain
MATNKNEKLIMFDNPEIDTNDLPKAGEVSWQAMDRKLVRRLLTEALIALMFVTIGVSVLRLIFNTAFAAEGVAISIAWLWLIPTLVGLVLFTWPLISVPKKGFAVRDKDILYKSGVFWHTVTAIPFNRIQHVEKSSTPLDRRFGLATLQLFTAGGTGGDLKVHGLAEELAENLRTFILKKVGAVTEHP